MTAPAVKRHRLTDQERVDRAVTGAELQHMITDLATILGYSWCHWRALQNKRGFWQVPVEGPLGTGWPDLFLGHPIKRLILGIEVKRELGDPVTPDQAAIHDFLRRCGMEVYVFRPSDLSSGRIQGVLQR